MYRYLQVSPTPIACGIGDPTEPAGKATREDDTGQDTQSTCSQDKQQHPWNQLAQRRTDGGLLAGLRDGRGELGACGRENAKYYTEHMVVIVYEWAGYRYLTRRQIAY